VQEIRELFGIPVIAVLDLSELMRYMQERGWHGELAGMQAYRAQYGI
jgi:hypothetical protein